MTYVWDPQQQRHSSTSSSSSSVLGLYILTPFSSPSSSRALLLPSLPPHPPTPPELAIPISPEASVKGLYEAIKRRDAGALNHLLAPDLEWWFHGPPNRQHLKRLLTGEDEAFEFFPQEVAAFGSIVVAEGGGPGAAVWVHAWTVGPDGVITQVREYFNTSLTVTRVEGDARGSDDESTGLTQCCVRVWQSQRSPKALPGLVLAI